VLVDCAGDCITIHRNQKKTYRGYGAHLGWHLLAGDLISAMLESSAKGS
jgi:hypothetical protein